MEKKPRYGLTLLLGALLIAILAPLSQFLTILAVNASIETATPVAWVVGIIFSLVLVNLAFGAIVRQRLMSRQSLVLLYGMLTIAVPLMNLGLVRQFVVSSQVLMEEYVYHATSTYRTAYNNLDPNWFPVIPTTEGLAWNRANRLLELLTDDQVLRERREAVREITLALTDPATFRQLERALAAGTAGEQLASLRESIGSLGEDEIASIRALNEPDRLVLFGLEGPLEERLEEAQEDSDTAASYLQETLPDFDEWAASLIPSNLETTDLSTRKRLEDAFAALSEGEREDLVARTRAMTEQSGPLREAVTALSRTDFADLRENLAAAQLADLQAMGPAEAAAQREHFVLRLSRAERREMLEQDGQIAPNQDLRSFATGLWDNPNAIREKESNTVLANVEEVFGAIPWNVWAQPLLRWCLLFLCLFLFLMCLAEWFRRKWVDRENLTFPVVEVVDTFIRHDCKVESATDALNPAPRGKNFHPLFLIGFGLGFLLLAVEALGHYGILPTRLTMSVNVSDTILTAEVFSNMRSIVFVISPIVVGLVFLLSLQLSFSIWFLYLLFMIGMWVGILINPEMRDSNFTGFNGGKLYPFPMEQFVGAALCYTLFLVFKSWGTPGKGGSGKQAVTTPYVPALLTRAGLFGLPVVIVLLFWSIGVTSLTLIALAAIVVLAQAIAVARLRAETGLPQYHSYYEMTKLPMVFGMTDEIGAKSFVSYVSTVFLPASLLFRSLGIQLENIELARRNRVSYRMVGLGALLAFVVAVGVGTLSFLVFSYYLGQDFYTASPQSSAQGTNGSVFFATMPLWVSHFLGESGLESYAHLNWLRMGFFGLGALFVGVLLIARQRILSFPLHPIGILLVLGSFFYNGVSPYVTTLDASREASVLWGSALVAWLIKSLIVKYGGMNAYKSAKPFFIGMVVGSVFCVFFFNGMDLLCSYLATQAQNPGEFLRIFVDVPPFTPAFY